MRITKIEPQKKNRHRKNVYADGRFIVGVSDEALLRSGLHVGDEIDGEQLAGLEHSDEAISARKVALHFLGARPRTRKEIRNKLREKEFADAEIEKTIHDLEDAQLLNDEEFACMFIRDSQRLRPIGKRLLTQKLLLLGVDRPTIETALGKTITEADQISVVLSTAERFLNKKARLRSDDALTRKKKLSAFLLRRGFEWEIVQRAVDQLLSHPGTSPE